MADKKNIPASAEYPRKVNKQGEPEADFDSKPKSISSKLSTQFKVPKSMRPKGSKD